jgi:hypothetical protein
LKNRHFFYEALLLLKGYYLMVNPLGKIKVVFIEKSMPIKQRVKKDMLDQ